MPNNARTAGTDRLIAVITAAALVTVVLVGLHRLGGDPDTARPGQFPSSLNPYSQEGSESATGLPSIRATNDAVPYARSISEALFTWDTTSGLYPRDYAAVVLAESAPGSDEANMLATDVAGYLPADNVWQQLRQYRTTQRIEIYGVQVAADWNRIVDAAHGQIPDGTTAITIRAFRHRDSIRDNVQDATREKISFTVLLACPPRVDDRCYLLRISELNDPL